MYYTRELLYWYNSGQFLWLPHPPFLSTDKKLRADLISFRKEVCEDVKIVGFSARWKKFLIIRQPPQKAALDGSKLCKSWHHHSAKCQGFVLQQTNKWMNNWVTIVRAGRAIWRLFLAETAFRTTRRASRFDHFRVLSQVLCRCRIYPISRCQGF